MDDSEASVIENQANIQVTTLRNLCNPHHLNQIKLEFRAEASNATNTPHFNNPNATINAANFLAVTSAVADQRQVRFGLRLMW